MSTQIKDWYVTKELTTCTCDGLKKDYQPGDVVEYEIKIHNPTLEDIQVAVTDDFSDVFASLTGTESLFGSAFALLAPIGKWEFFTDVPACSVQCIKLKLTIKDDLCAPCSVHQEVKVCLSGADDPNELRCVCKTAKACPIVVGERSELKIDPDCYNPKGMVESLLTCGSEGKVIDYINKGGSLSDLIDKACGPSEITLSEENLAEICAIVLEKFGTAELKAVIQGCIDTWWAGINIFGIIEQYIATNPLALKTFVQTCINAWWSGINIFGIIEQWLATNPPALKAWVIKCIEGWWASILPENKASLAEAVKCWVVDCLTNPDTAPITKEFLGEVVQGEDLDDSGTLGQTLTATQIEASGAVLGVDYVTNSAGAAIVTTTGSIKGVRGNP